MNTYLLTANKDGRKRSHTFTEDSDTAAMFYGTAAVMRRAYTDRIWAEGRIVLTNRSTGEVLATMNEKVPA